MTPTRVHQWTRPELTPRYRVSLVKARPFPYIPTHAPVEFRDIDSGVWKRGGFYVDSPNAGMAYVWQKGHGGGVVPVMRHEVRAWR